jgi:hypothetical protein
MRIAADRGHSTGPPCSAVHNGCIEFNHAKKVGKTTDTDVVILGIRLDATDCNLNSIHRRPVRAQHIHRVG